MVTDDRPTTTPRIEALLARERRRFELANPESARLAAACAPHWFAGAPLHWMADWPLPFPLFVREARGARLVDADGHAYSDFCLGDSAALFGHGHEAIAAALAARAERGLATMLPAPDAAWVGEELGRRFGLPVWQVATSASDANRSMLRWARAVTGRPVVLVFDGCYHGALDDTLVRLTDDGTRPAPGLLGQVGATASTTRAVEFNDVDALAAALAPGDVAAVLCEPALTNAGLVLPTPDFHAQLRALTRRHGTLLLLDETHTLCAGPGGYARAHGLEPDGLVIGKAIAGGLPCAVYGVTDGFAAGMRDAWRRAGPGRTGLGTTLSGSPLQLAALRATLESAMSEGAYARMLALAERLAHGLAAVFERHGVDWRVTRLGARCEVHRAPVPPRTAREAEEGARPALARLVHLYLLNRGIVVSPFHDMMLTSPAAGSDDVHALLDALDACLYELADDPP